MITKILDSRTWTNLELQGLLEDDESYVHFERATRHLGLHPFHLTNLNAALREILGSTLYSYDAKLKGIVLSYKNPKLLSRLGTVLHDTCFVHIDIEADFYVFRPNVGDSMRGIVNKKSQDHVGILVHKVFNVSILRPDGDDGDDWPGYSVEIGQEVRFTIDCLDFKGKLPYIRGSMDATNYLEGCKLFDANFARPVDDGEPEPKKTTFSFDDGQDRLEADCGADSNVDTKNDSRRPLDGEIEEKVSSRKQKKLKRERGEDETTRVKRKKKQKHEDGSQLSDDESKLVKSNGIDEGNSGCDDEFSARKLKILKEDNDEVKIPAKKKKRSKVKVEETLSDDQTRVDDEKIKFSKETRDAAEGYPSEKPTKLKGEKVDDDVCDKYKKKPKLEVEITYADEEFDVARENNGGVQVKNEHTEERRRKKRSERKVELRTSESDADASQANRVKRARNGSNGGRIKKRDRIKTEVPSSADECNAVTGEEKSSSRTRLDSHNENNIGEERRAIKTEARWSSDISD